MLQLPATIPRFVQNKVDDLLDFKIPGGSGKGNKGALDKDHYKNIDQKNTNTELKLQMLWRIQNQ
jgi:hypothetical protein